MIRRIFFIVAISGVLASCSENKKPEADKAVNVIFDTDMGPDYDDAGAIALLHYYQSKGKANILATIASTKYDRVGPVLSIFNTYFKNPDIPIGVPKEDALPSADWQKWSDTLVAKYPHQLKSNADALDAVELYRKILANQPDSSVTIITVGFFNNIAGLLRSKPDKYSDLSGVELIDKKVIKMVSMAGAFPDGREFNMDEQPAASKYVFDNWTKPVIFSGFEIGEKVITGLPLVNDNTIQNNPVKDVYRISIPKDKQDVNGRMSWDQTAVLVGVEGYEPYYKLQQGKIVVTEDGANSWINDPKGNQYYLVSVLPPKQVEDLINELMRYQPNNK